jgi:molybdate-binding protein/DNA-binding XRE family transcriptional regulator
MSGLRSEVRERRRQAGLQQQDLAARVGVSRQSLSAIEAGETVPSTALALELARALGCRVEDLFSLAESAQIASVAVAPSLGRPLPAVTAGSRLRLGLVGGTWVAHRLEGDTSMVAADALAARTRRGAVAVTPLRELGPLRANLLVAGCDPALGLLAGHLAEGPAGVRLHWIEGASGSALDALARGLVHVAGLHLFDPATGEYNLPAVRARLGARPVVLVTLASWEQGLVVRPGSARRIRRPADLAARGVKVAMREPGSGARALLERLLADERVPLSRLTVAATEYSHQAIAHRVASGSADAGVATAAAAAAFGLTFVPLAEDRFDLVMTAETMEGASGRRLVEALASAPFRRDIGALRGYGTADTGRRFAA